MAVDRPLAKPGEPQERRQGERRQEQSVGLLAIADRLDAYPELVYEATVLRRMASDRRASDRRR